MTKIEGVKKEGVAGAKLGENPLTIWLLTAVIIVYLYIRRSHIGVDLHPAEQKPAIKVPAPKQKQVTIPVLPSAGIDWSSRL